MYLDGSTRLSQSGCMFFGLHTWSELSFNLAHSGIKTFLFFCFYFRNLVSEQGLLKQEKPLDCSYSLHGFIGFISSLQGKSLDNSWLFDRRKFLFIYRPRVPIQQSELSLQTAAWVRVSAATIHSCSYSFQVSLIIWCLLHDRYTPHQNSRSCFDSSVWLMSSRQDDMSPSREPFGKESILQSDSEFTLL